MMDKLLTPDDVPEFGKKMADALARVIPIIQKFNSEMQQFTDSIAPPVDAAIDGESVKARILPSGSEKGARRDDNGQAADPR